MLPSGGDLAFIVPADSLYASKGGKQSTALLIDVCEPQQPAWHNDPNGTVVAHTHLSSNQRLSGWTQNPLNKRETRPDTRNQANDSMLVKSWILEESLQPLLYESRIIPNNNLETFVLIYIVKCSPYPL